MNVAFISPHAQLGGSQRYLEMLLGKLPTDIVSAVISLQDGPFPARARALGYPVDIVNTPARLGMLPAAWRLRRALMCLRPDVIHANGIKAALMSVLATPGTGIPVIWVKHDFSWDGWLGRLVGYGCRDIICVSSAVAEPLGRRLGRRVSVVHNGIPDSLPRRLPSRTLVVETLGCGADAWVVSLVGRLHPAKGQIELIELASDLLKRHPRIHFALVGDEDAYVPGYAHSLRQRVHDLRLSHKITFVGYRDDAISFIAGSDLLAIPSVPNEHGVGKEGFGLTGIEALAVGTPVVGYADGALPEVLGSCAILVPAGDRSALGAAIASLADDDDLRQQLVACGRARFDERYRLCSTVEAMSSHYRRFRAPPVSMEWRKPPHDA